MQDRIIICGDLNAASISWGSKITTARGKLVEEWAATLGIICLNNGKHPTCIRWQGSSMVDTTWINENAIVHIRNWHVAEEETLSDHAYIITEIGTACIPEKKRKQQIKKGNHINTYSGNNTDNKRVKYNNNGTNTTNKRVNSVNKKANMTMEHASNKIDIGFCKYNWERINLDMFLAVLEIQDWMHNRKEEPSREAIKLSNIMRVAAKIATPKKGKFTGRPAVYWWNNELNAIHKKCNAQRRRYMRQRKRDATSQMTQDMFEEWMLIRNEYRNKIKSAKKQAWTEIMNTLEENPWGKPYKIVLKKINRTPSDLTTRMPSCEVNRILDELFPKVNNEESTETTVVPEYDRVTIHEIEGIIKQITKRNPAPGPDGISAKAVKMITKTLPMRTADVFNGCMSTGCFPAQWKESRLVLLRKEAKPIEKASSYRPICLINEMSKMLERVIASRIKRQLKDVGPDLYKHQYGFRQGSSTTDAIINAKSVITNALERDKSVIGISLDITNAFNTIRWHDIIKATRKRKFPIYLSNIIDNYLSNRTIMYIDENNNMIKRNTYCGVPQGSVLGPILWNIAFDRVIGEPLPDNARIIAYADDILLLVENNSIEELKTDAEIILAIIERRIRRLSLQLAPHKTEAVIFSHRPVKGKNYIDVSRYMVK